MAAVCFRIDFIKTLTVCFVVFLAAEEMHLTNRYDAVSTTYSSVTRAPGCWVQKTLKKSESTQVKQFSV